jgi:hypothetical protein
MFCKTLGCEFTAIPSTDCPADGFDAVQVWLCGNSVAIGHFDTEDEAEAAALAERDQQLRDNGQFGAGA